MFLLSTLFTPILLSDEDTSDTDTTTIESSNAETENTSNSDSTDTPSETTSIQITSPKPEQTFQNDEVINVNVTISPQLNPDDKVSILVDGEPIGEPVHATSMSLPLLDRGEHTLQAKVIVNEEEIAVSNLITIYQQRHSILLGPSPGPVTKTNQMGVRQKP
jgi:hypothetical protein